MTAIEAFLALLLADFVSGIFHWLEDRYGDPAWPVVGPLIVEPNIEHHTDQMAFTVGGYWGRNWTTIIPAAVAAAVACVAGFRLPALAFAFLSQANEVHAWAHQRCSRPIRGLQLLGFLQSPEQHARHHRNPFDTNYCVMTDFVNPVLSFVGFWPTVEAAIRVATGICPRPERAEA